MLKALENLDFYLARAKRPATANSTQHFAYYKLFPLTLTFDRYFALTPLATTLKSDSPDSMRYCQESAQLNRPNIKP
ncbi:hypothetical protein [Dendronalium sp. ChiSLP03b]|uniref:hypothetical protein n=1 Tax=Dendronalium sp. ChiSLP03b TaxID=3075381 RepID=UPI002AD1FAB7|nr:hypothetical protein [Dendronalium sp. ChiSLP03b]MDZ8208816.1 hypothetical protein [Dendronalium sp. ChiSLP03b]